MHYTALHCIATIAPCIRCWSVLGEAHPLRLKDPQSPVQEVVRERSDLEISTFWEPFYISHNLTLYRSVSITASLSKESWFKSLSRWSLHWSLFIHSYNRLLKQPKMKSAKVEMDLFQCSAKQLMHCRTPSFNNFFRKTICAHIQVNKAK